MTHGRVATPVPKQQIQQVIDQGFSVEWMPTLTI